MILKISKKISLISNEYYFLSHLITINIIIKEISLNMLKYLTILLTNYDMYHFINVIEGKINDKIIFFGKIIRIFQDENKYDLNLLNFIYRELEYENSFIIVSNLIIKNELSKQIINNINT